MSLTGSFSKRPVGHRVHHTPRWRSVCAIITTIVVTVGFVLVVWALLADMRNSVSAPTATRFALHEGREEQERAVVSNVMSEGGLFRGGAPWRTRKTLAAKLLLETPWVRVEEHTIAVQSPSGATVQVRDWKWIDVADQVNVLVSVTLETLQEYRALKRRAQKRLNAPPLQKTTVHRPPVSTVVLLQAATEPEENVLANDTEVFMLFEQEKYGYEGLSFAVVGGLLEPNEMPLLAAEREVHEELGFSRCAMMSLGKYRTDVNRGGGFVNSFLARRCQLDVDEAHKHQEDRANSDLERQTPVAMSREFIKQLLLTRTSEAVKEVKWCNTIAMSLLMMENGLDAGAPSGRGIS